MLRHGARRFCPTLGRQAFNPQLLTRVKEIEQRAQALYERHLIPMDRYNLVPRQRSATPMVLLLGNHSSGKSTFINFLLRQKEQETGVAPTDDAFTVLARSENKSDMDGQTLVSDVEMGFSELRHHGPTLVNHLKFKRRPLDPECPLPQGLMIVDTPGMIDTPVKNQDSRESRGYDFLKVVRWFAERSDVILLLFDPNNPGTTGETLDVLIESLADMEHKMLLILNKVDQITQVHDFARSYGSLCWNLAKVIPRKDLPRIFTMFTPITPNSPGQSNPLYPDRPVSDQQLSAADERIAEAASSMIHAPDTHIPLKSFNLTRDDVVAEIVRAPQRRVDNLVTQAEESINRLIISSRIHNGIRQRLRSKYMSHVLTLGGCGIAMLAGAFGVVSGALPPQVGLSLAVGGAAVAFASFYHFRKSDEFQQRLILQDLDKIFENEFRSQVEDDADLRARWQIVKPKMIRELKHLDLNKLPVISNRQIAALQTVRDTEVVALRQKSAGIRDEFWKQHKTNVATPTEAPASAA